MWFLLLIITSYMNRNCLPEFSDLYELLYKDEEAVPSPDLASFTSVIRLAPLSIWIHLNARANTETANLGLSQSAASGSSLSGGGGVGGASKTKQPVVMPEILRGNYALLHDRMATQQFFDFGLSACMNAFSTDTALFTVAFNSMLERIGKNSMTGVNTGSPPSSSTSNVVSNSGVFTSHEPLSFEMITSFTLHVRIHVAQYLTVLLTQKNQIIKTLNLNIPAAIVETFARLLIFDPDNFIKVRRAFISKY